MGRTIEYKSENIQAGNLESDGRAVDDLFTAPFDDCSHIVLPAVLVQVYRLWASEVCESHEGKPELRPEREGSLGKEGTQSTTLLHYLLELEI